MGDNFIMPKNIEELCHALRDKDDNTYILAGGTDLIIKFIKDNILDFKIIDISSFSKFRSIENIGDKIKIGSSVTMTEIENSELIKKEVPALATAAYNVGSTQIRNRATIGGNLANAAQCGDTIPVLFAYDADIELLNSSKEIRYVKARAFVTGIGKTTLGKDEVITAILIKKSNFISGFSKVGSRKSVTISKVNCCGKILLNEEDIIQDAEVYMGAVGVKPVKAELIEKKLIGKTLGISSGELEESIMEQVESAIPNRSSKHYKKIAAIGLVKDMLADMRR